MLASSTARILERGWRVIERYNGDGALLECLECHARIERVRVDSHVPRACWHPVVDEASRYEDDVPCRLLVHRLGPMTLEECGQALGVTRERVRQIEEKALRHLRQRFLTLGWSEDDVRELLAHLAQRVAPEEAWDVARGRSQGAPSGVSAPPAPQHRRPDHAAGPVRHLVVAPVRPTPANDTTPTPASPADEEETRMGALTLKDRECVACKKTYTPTGARQKRCSECGRSKPSKRAAGDALNRAIDGAIADRAPATNSPAGPPAATVDGAVELLELAGYRVRAVKTPAGVALFVGGGGS